MNILTHIHTRFYACCAGVIGGGDSALEEAVYLTKYSPMVHLFVRGSTLRASKTLQDRAINNPKVTVHMNTVVLDVYGSGNRSVLSMYTHITCVVWLNVCGICYIYLCK